ACGTRFGRGSEPSLGGKFPQVPFPGGSDRERQPAVHTSRDHPDYVRSLVAARLMPRGFVSVLRVAPNSAPELGHIRVSAHLFASLPRRISVEMPSERLAAVPATPERRGPCLHWSPRDSLLRFALLRRS